MQDSPSRHPLRNLQLAIALLTPRERRQAVLLMAIMVAMSLLDVVGMASIMPFLAVMASPEIIQSQSTLRGLYNSLGVDRMETFLYILGGASAAIIVVSGFLRLFGQYALTRYTQMRAHSIGVRLLDIYLRRPYEFYLNNHSADLSKSVLAEVGSVVMHVYTPLSQIISYSIVIAFLSVLLVFVDFKVAITVFLFISVFYVLFYLAIRSYLARVGRERFVANIDKYRSVSEVLGGIKPIKLLGKESIYLDRFSSATLLMARHQAANTTISLLPKFVIESIGFGGIILLTLALMLHYGGYQAGALGKVLPLLGLYAFVGYRMMPAVQQVYAASTVLRTGTAALESIHDAFLASETLPPLQRKSAAPMEPRTLVEIRDLSFRYTGAAEAGLKGVSLKIPIGSSVGVVGSTGAGKTTLVDVILGLLKAQEGQILVDGVAVTPDNLRAWQGCLGYVPQDIFLIDGAVSDNIALGVRPTQIDMDRVRECAAMAQIRDFIESELPDGFDTTVGERGVRLSGGQRQRIGIARALYHNPSIIIFDEATSALDNLTEQEVMRAVNQLSGQNTVIMIAHRISTVRDCDQIVVLEKGRVAAVGDYERLYADSAAFRKLVDAAQAV